MSITLRDERFSRLIANLRELHGGSIAVGRWIEQSDYEAVGHDATAPDEGFYNRDSPPEGYDREGWIGTGEDGEEEPAEPLIPAEWEAYTLEEQTDWLGTCARVARETLEMLGEPVPTSPGSNKAEKMHD